MNKREFEDIGNLYQILCVDPKAPVGVIRAAWKALNITHHPDHGGNVKDVQRINFAKEVLIDIAKRKEYDEYVRNQNQQGIGNYEIIEQIGEGAFGRTYKAKHKILGGYACLKQNINVSAEDNRLLIDEAKLLWDIHHYSLPTLRDLFRADDGSSVIAMSYVDGTTLEKIIDGKQALDPEHVCWITQRLLNALHYLHYHGIVHCDIKPANIIIKPDEHNAVLVDYGFASIKPRYQSEPKGYTPAFAPPELMTKMPPTPESDLYSLGVSMIYALGGNPFSKSMPAKTPKKIQEYLDALVLHDPMQRPCWDKSDLVKDLSKVRYEVFGRKSSNKKLEV